MNRLTTPLRVLRLALGLTATLAQALPPAHDPVLRGPAPLRTELGVAEVHQRGAHRHPGAAYQYLVVGLTPSQTG